MGWQARREILMGRISAMQNDLIALCIRYRMMKEGAKKVVAKRGLRNKSWR